MIDSWKPLLAERAKLFTGEEDGYQMVHACDDRGKAIGKFWTGIIDHANTSWVAQLMWQYGKYARDEEFLLREVYPFMKKTLNVFIRMMEYKDGMYILPVSISPEYGGAGNEAWGQNSTFFLTNVHFLCNKILHIAAQYQIDSDYAEKVREIRENLPLTRRGKGRVAKSSICGRASRWRKAIATIPTWRGFFLLTRFLTRMKSTRT
ncbi:hypothetical protein N6H14_26520 [Paenibacillus sp. CC-CFT747]|nr:hypothetical protein N6H14_26520 [Paenibacillus sp. CC-CFT747]